MPVEHISAMDTFNGSAPGLDAYNRIPELAMTMQTVAKAASYTLLPEDSGKIFTTTGATGAVTFTLPAVTNTGFVAWFCNTVDQNMTVASAEGDNVVAVNDAAADSIAFSTASNKIGGAVMVVSNGTLWLPFVSAMLGAVPTIAT